MLIFVRTFFQLLNWTCQTFKVSFLCIIKDIRMRCLIMKYLVCFFKPSFASLRWILSSISNKYCCISFCYLLHSIIFTFSLIYRLKGFPMLFNWCKVVPRVYNWSDFLLDQCFPITCRRPVTFFRKKIILIHWSWFFNLKAIFILSSFD